MVAVNILYNAIINGMTLIMMFIYNGYFKGWKQTS